MLLTRRWNSISVTIDGIVSERHREDLPLPNRRATSSVGRRDRKYWRELA